MDMQAIDKSPYKLGQKRLAELDEVDRLPSEIRKVVFEFGLPVVRSMLKFGIKSPRHMREIIREVWLGGRQSGQSSGAFNTLDVLLARGPVSSKALIRLLADNNMAIVSCEPTKAMIEASLQEVSGGNVIVGKEEKHRRRLRAAMRAAMKQYL